VQKASEPVHIQWNEDNDHLQVINNLPALLTDAKAAATFYSLSGEKLEERSFEVAANPSSVADLGVLPLPSSSSSVVFLKLKLTSHDGESLSTNLYWRGTKDANDLTGLNEMPPATVTTFARREDGKVVVALHNPGSNIALMTHVQLRRLDSGKRVLPAFASENYITLLPGETETVTINVDGSLLQGTRPLVTVDGWNVHVPAASSSGAEIRPNLDADPEHTPATGLPMASPTK
jgi:hypothetical protein